MQLIMIHKACPTFSGVRLNWYWQDMIALSDNRESQVSMS